MRVRRHLRAGRRRDLKRGLTCVEVVILLAILAILVACLLPTILAARKTSREVRDADRMMAVHAALIGYAQENDGHLPQPGRIDWLPAVGFPGPDVPPGAINFFEDEDHALNHTAPLYSLLIAQQRIGPDAFVSPCEVNPSITVKHDYDFSIYRPFDGRYWDTTFTMHIDDPTIGANASDAHLALIGERRRLLWNTNAPPTAPHLSTRGPEHGASDTTAYRNSPTLRMLGDPDRWVGHVVLADHTWQRWTSFTLRPGADAYTMQTAEAEALPDDAGTFRLFADGDNMFAADFTHPFGAHYADDVFLGVFTNSSAHTVTPVWDPTPES